MVVTEYMPKNLQHSCLLLKIFLVLVSISLSVGFLSRTEQLREQERGYLQLQQELQELEQLLQRGKEALDTGSDAEAERDLLTLIEHRAADPEPYLLLADLYVKHRLYEDAMETLAAYGGEDPEIARKEEELRTMVTELEQSIFVRQ